METIDSQGTALEKSQGLLVIFLLTLTIPLHQQQLLTREGLVGETHLKSTELKKKVGPGVTTLGWSWSESEMNVTVYIATYAPHFSSQK